MSDFPVLFPEPEPEPTGAALDEAAFFASRERLRGDVRQSHLHLGGLIVFWSALIVLLSMIVVWAWHILTPDSWQFLNHEAKDKLQTILISILGSSFVSGAARRWIGDKGSLNQQPGNKLSDLG